MSDAEFDPAIVKAVIDEITGDSKFPDPPVGTPSSTENSIAKLWSQATEKPVFRNVLQQATAEWVTAILAYYRRRKNLTGVYMRGYFAGMSDREVLGLATQLHESSIKYPAWSEGEPVEINTSSHLHVIEKISDSDDIVTLEDGYQYFMPKSGGAMSASVLRILAAELDRRNAVWDEQVQKELARLADKAEENNDNVRDLG